MQRFMFLPLEERIVLDGAIAATTIMGVSEHNAEQTDAHLDSNVAVTQVTEAEANLAQDQVDFTQTISENTAKMFAQSHSPEQGINLLLINSNLIDLQTLENAVKSDVIVLQYDPSIASLKSLSQEIQIALQGHKADSIGIATDGRPGQLALIQSLAMNSAQLANPEVIAFWHSIAENMHANGDLNLLSCYTASGMEGMTFITQLQNIMDEQGTQIKVNASTDLTGSATLGGDWILEQGNVDAENLYFDSLALGNWNNILVAFSPHLNVQLTHFDSGPSPFSFHAFDLVTYRFVIANESGTIFDPSASATNTILRNSIPTNVIYIPDSIRIIAQTGGGYTGLITDSSSDFDPGYFDSINNQIVVNLGTGASNTIGGTLTVGSTTIVEYLIYIPSDIIDQSAVTNIGGIVTATGAVFFDAVSQQSNSRTFTASNPSAAVGDLFPILANTAISISASQGLLSNDDNPDGGQLSVVLESLSVPAGTVVVDPTGNFATILTTSGEAIVRPDGSFDYTPNGDFELVDAFTYQALNALSGVTTDSATVEIGLYEMAVDKTVTNLNATSTFLPGDTVEYTITVTNTGYIDSFLSTLEDVLPDGLTLVDQSITIISDPSGSDMLSIDSTNSTIIVNLGQDAGSQFAGVMLSGQTTVISFQATINFDAPLTPVTNIADVYGTYDFQTVDVVASATTSFTVTFPNNEPSGASNTVTVLEDSSHTFEATEFGFSDVDGNSLIGVRISTLPALGTLTHNSIAVTAGEIISVANIDSGLLKFIPVPNANGASYSSFTFQVQDNGGTLNGGIDFDQTPDTMTINVTSVNDAPSGSNKTVAFLEDHVYTFAEADFGFSDVDGNSLKNVTVMALPSDGLLTINGDAVAENQLVDAADIQAGLFRFFPLDNANGTAYASFDFRAQDDGGTENGGVDADPTVRRTMIDIASVNDAPSGADNAITILEDESHTFNTAEFGFSDVDGNSFEAVMITNAPSAGTLRLGGNLVTDGQIINVASIGSLVFSPDPEGSGLPYANFTFQVQDDGGTENDGVDIDESLNTMTINVTPAPRVLSVGNVIVNEADLVAEFTILLDRLAIEEVSFNIALVDDSARGIGVDFGTSGADNIQVFDGVATWLPATSATIGIGRTSLQLRTLISPDNIYELSESFTLALSNITNASATSASALATILDDDDVPTISIDNVVLPEGTTGATDYVFTVELSNPSSQSITVDFATLDAVDFAALGAIATLIDNDYIASSGTLTFAPEEISKTITVKVMGDTKFEADEILAFKLSNLAGAVFDEESPFFDAIDYTIIGGGGILNDDAIPSVNITPAILSQTEGNSGQKAYTFNVDLSAAAGTPLAVGYETQDGTATTAGNDYVSNTGFLFFLPGETHKTVTVLINGDNVYEPNETFYVNFTNAEAFQDRRDPRDLRDPIELRDPRDLRDPIELRDPRDPRDPADGLPILPIQVQGVIANDDPLPTISINNVSRNEGNSLTTDYTFTVKLSNPSSQQVSVNYAAANGTALLSNNDYQSKTGTLIFAPGEISKTVIVKVAGDVKFETNETFVLNLSNAVNGTLPVSTRGIGTIVNDDPVPLKANLDSYTTNENRALGVGGKGVLTNDIATPGNVLVVEGIPVNGSIEKATLTGGKVKIFYDGHFVYTPKVGFFGNDSFTYQAVDKTAGVTSLVTTVTINVKPVAPVASNDVYITRPNAKLAVSTVSQGILANDIAIIGANGKPDALVSKPIKTTTAHGGTVLLNTNGTFTYTPPRNFTGIDNFKYVAADNVNHTQSSITTVYIGVAPAAFSGCRPSSTDPLSAISGLLSKPDLTLTPSDMSYLNSRFSRLAQTAAIKALKAA